MDGYNGQNMEGTFMHELYIVGFEERGSSSERAARIKREIQGRSMSVQLKRSESAGKTACIVTLYINQT